MKTTIKLSSGMFNWLSVDASKSGGVAFEAGPAPTDTNSVRWEMTPDQCGALMFGVEQALEVGEVLELRKAA